MPMWVVPGTACGDLFCCEAEQKEILFARLLRHLDRRAVTRPMVNAPFIMNFMLLVPLAS